MLPMFEAYLDRLTMLHTEIRRTIEGLPPEVLDWLPGPEMSSLAVLAEHVAGSQRFWVGEVAGGDPAHRNRPAEFQTHGLDEAALLSRLDASLAHTRATLEKLTMPDLEVRRPGMDGEEVTAAWALFHNLQHLGTHLGQMQLTRQLWEQQQGEQR
jgi:uncharacterized damage-inducible protein DinB